MWGELCRAQDLGEAWAGLAYHVSDNLADWKRIYDSVEPQNEAMPDPWASALDPFQRIVVLRTLRPDKVGAAGWFCSLQGAAGTGVWWGPSGAFKQSWC